MYVKASFALVTRGFLLSPQCLASTALIWTDVQNITKGKYSKSVVLN